MQQSSATLKNRDVGIGLRKIVACSQSSSQAYAGLAFDTIYSAWRLRRDDITRTYAHAYCARESCPPLALEHSVVVTYVYNYA